MVRYPNEPEQLLPRLRLRRDGSGGDVDPEHRELFPAASTADRPAVRGVPPVDDDDDDEDTWPR